MVLSGGPRKKSPVTPLEIDPGGVTRDFSVYYRHRKPPTSSCFHRASIVSKTILIVPTDANYYKII